MDTSAAYFSITSQSTAELTVKGSKFIAHAIPIENRDNAEVFIAEISHKYHDATHNCFAYKIGVGDGGEFRFSDAGEPSGTAGRPILQAIESRNLTNLVVVVTRYFGGTKLGTGGLIRAYSAAALAALDEATIVKKFPTAKLRLTFGYEFTNPVHQIIQKFQAEIIESRFSEDTNYLIEVREKDLTDFKAELKNISRGQIEIDS